MKVDRLDNVKRSTGVSDLRVGGGTLRAQIREIVDNAERRLLASEIYAQLKKGSASTHLFGVTIAQMVDEGYLRKRKVPKSLRSIGVRFVYGPGRRAVEDHCAHRPQRSAMKGFMQLARERKARERARRAVARRAAA